MYPPRETLLQNLLDAAGECQSTEGVPESFGEAIEALAERKIPLAEVMPLIPQVRSPIGAGWLALFMGAEVENGALPEASVNGLVDAMLHWTQAVETIDHGEAEEEEEEDPDPDPAILDGLQFMGQGLVAHLGRIIDIPSVVPRHGELAAEVDRLSHLSIGAMWVAEIFRQDSGRLIVLHGTEPYGVEVSYEHIANNFHLFTLLQGTLPDAPGAVDVNPALMRLALGMDEASQTASDRAWWHYGQPSRNEAELGASVWGEGRPSEIEAIDGQQVLLLWPPLLTSRSWDGGFLGPILHVRRPHLELTRYLAPEELADWRRRLDLPALA